MLDTGTNIKCVSMLLGYSHVTFPNLTRKETISTHPGRSDLRGSQNLIFMRTGSAFFGETFHFTLEPSTDSPSLLRHSAFFVNNFNARHRTLGIDVE